MNYTSPHHAESTSTHILVKQSDEIIKKIHQIRNSIDSHPDTSPNNLFDYIPNQKYITTQHQKQEKINGENNLQSYRHSLEKKLERLFKEEKIGFNDSLTGINAQNHINFQITHNNFDNYTKISNKDQFTIQKMEYKIKQLERKYLHIDPSTNQFPTNIPKKQKPQKQLAHTLKDPISKPTDLNATPNKKSKSLLERQPSKNHNKTLITGQKQKIQQKCERKLLTEINSLKKQLQIIKKSNYQLNDKIQHKQQQRKNRKQRSKYLLRCILSKLIDIQQQYTRRDHHEQNAQQKRNKIQMPMMTPAEQRQKLKNQNYHLIKHIKELNKLLKKQTNEKEIIEERNQWFEQKIKKIPTLTGIV